MKPWHILSLFLALTLVAGCNDRGRPAGTHPTGQPSDKPQAAAGRAASNAPQSGDAWLTTSVQSKFFADPTIKGSAIDVRTSDGIVTLNGTVPSDQARKLAIQVARGVDGVRRVEDRLRISPELAASTATSGTLEPPSSTAPTERHDDLSITTLVQARFFTTPEIARRNIAVTTTNGTVTLNGDVRNEDERQQALRIAKGVPGVSSVNDRLAVNPEGGPTGRRNGAPTGQTGTADAGGGATVNRLPVVAPPPAKAPVPPPAGGLENTAENAGLGQPIDDNMLKTKIQSLFFENDQTRNSRIAVAVDHGIVTLSGTASDAGARLQAVQLAKATAGVVRVVDQMGVQRR